MSLLLSNDFASQRAVTEEEDHLGLNSAFACRSLAYLEWFWKSMDQAQHSFRPVPVHRDMRRQRITVQTGAVISFKDTAHRSTSASP